MKKEIRLIKNNSKPKRIIPAVSRSLKILEFLSAGNISRFSEIAGVFSLPANSLSRLLETLSAAGYIAKAGQYYQLVKNMFNSVVINIAHYEILEKNRAAIRKNLKNISERLKLAAGVFVISGNNTMRIFDAYNRGDSAYHFSTVNLEVPMLPAHGFARIFLAYMSEEELGKIIELDLALRSHYKNNLQTEKSGYLKIMSEIKKNGFSIEDREYLPFLTRVTAPVFLKGAGIPLLSLGVIGPPSILEKKKLISRELLKTAGKMSRMINNCL
ncbi:MAG: hypothetical protein A2096_14280 [Spirochaetes bacterium GWF1_41_5]|nr:MAG: hypothetical protein A2096_14280 [Spirochaetes bacterium GWF1_41_5]HBE03405.1 hypothetical protein [Spirochaetia bacterium]